MIILLTTYKKQLKIQCIGIFEEIDSFYWPKMHFLKKGQKIRAWVDPPPWFGQCPKENVFFQLRPSLMSNMRRRCTFNKISGTWRFCNNIAFHFVHILCKSMNSSTKRCIGREKKAILQESFKRTFNNFDKRWKVFWCKTHLSSKLFRLTIYHIC